MDADEWSGCRNPERMLGSLKGRSGDREFRLFAVACCRRLLPSLHDDRLRDVVEEAGRLSESPWPLGPDQVARLRATAFGLFQDSLVAQDFAFNHVTLSACAVKDLLSFSRNAWYSALSGSRACRRAVAARALQGEGGPAWESEGAHQAALLREIVARFGLPAVGPAPC